MKTAVQRRDPVLDPQGPKPRVHLGAPDETHVRRSLPLPWLESANHLQTPEEGDLSSNAEGGKVRPPRIAGSLAEGLGARHARDRGQRTRAVSLQVPRAARGDCSCGACCWRLAVRAGGSIIVVVARKKEKNFVASLSDGSLGFVMGEMASLSAAAVVVEARYSSLFRVPKVTPGWLPQVLSRLQVRYPTVPIVFCENRKLAEECTYRFLAAALREFDVASSPLGTQE